MVHMEVDGGKRPREGDASGPRSTLARSEVTELLEELREHGRKQMEEQSRMYELLLEQTLTKWEAKIDPRMEAIETATRALTERVEASAVEQATIKAAVEELQRRADAFPPLPRAAGGGAAPRTPSPRAARSSASTVGSTRASSHTQEADPTILRINTPEMVPLAAIKKELEKVLEEAGLRATGLEVKGRAIDRFFSAAAAGEYNERVEAVERVLASLRLPEGGWKPVSVRSQAGHEVRVYIGRDKTKEQVTRERGAKRLADIIKAKLVGEQAGVVLSGAVVTVQWTPLVRVSTDSQGLPYLMWNGEEATKRGINREDINQAFAEASAKARVAAAPGKVEWCL